MIDDNLMYYAIENFLTISEMKHCKILAFLAVLRVLCVTAFNIVTKAESYFSWIHFKDPWINPS